jgi:hypothetical protein
MSRAFTQLPYGHQTRGVTDDNQGSPAADALDYEPFAGLPRTRGSVLSPAQWSWLFCAITAGYLLASRSFAYIGIPPLKLFIGEIVLGTFLCTNLIPALRVGVVEVEGMSPLSRLMTDFRWPLLLFILCGMWCVANGLMQSYPPMVAIECFAFNYYTVYLIPAVWLGIQFPDAIPRLIRWLSVVHGIYGLLYIAIFNSFDWLTIPGSPDVPVFGPPNGAAIMILSLLSLPKEQRLGKWTVPVLLMNTIVLLGMQVRAEWLGFGFGVVVLAILHRPSRPAIIGFVSAAVVLGAIAFVADIKMAAPSSRGGEISTRGVVGRMIATVNPDLAEGYVDNADDVAGTVDWRKNWWKEIWRTINDSDSDKIYFTGLGYGFPLTGLVTYIDTETGLRTPHNVFYYTLAYGGWLGVACMGLFQSCLAWGLFQAYRKTGSPLGLIFWCVSFADAFFSNYLENPFGAVPFYIVIGMCLAPNWWLLRSRDAVWEPTR